MTSRHRLPAKWLTWFMILALGVAVAACSSPEERARAHYESGKSPA